MRNPLREICTVGSVRGEILVAMVDLNAHEAGNGGQKPRDAYSLPSLLYSEDNGALGQKTISFQIPPRN